MSQSSPTTTSSSSFTQDDASNEPWLPTLANGHLGFTVFGDAVYVNGLYNGQLGLSHRARIANVANLRIDAGGNPRPPTLVGQSRMDFARGTFFVDYRGPNNSYRVTQAIYPHQLYNRAIVNQFRIERLRVEGDIHLSITQASTSPTSEDIVFNSTAESVIFISRGAERPSSSGVVVVAATKDEYSTAAEEAFQVHQACGSTREPEDPSSRSQPRQVCVLWNHVPERLTLKRSERTVSYKFIMTADESASRARRDLEQALRITDDDELLRRHTDIWASFWNRFDIQLEGDPDLEQTVRASLFYLISNFPLGTNGTDDEPFQFGGLSPTGLGRGGSDLDDYEGHSFWDTEIWMFPVVNLVEAGFAEMAIDYRFRRMDAAREYARTGGYHGVRYPWESASTGIEVTQPDYMDSVAAFQQHITGDISFALRQHLATTQNLDWLRTRGCPLAQEIAQFWASRLSLDPVTGLYDIKAVMGPDEDHKNVTNNAYTNVIAGYALYFGDLTKCLVSSCDQDRDKAAPPTEGGNWSDLASRIKLLYDAENDYHPQFEGYRRDTVIKQADTVLLGYPLQYPGLTTTARSNDLRFYEAVTRSSGPAMTWAIHAVNHLDLGEEREAARRFEQSYRDYVRGPYRVWSEVGPGQSGARNFITGAGGFLQAVINGYGGVRVFLDHLEIQNSRLPPGSATSFKIKGLQYLGARLTLTVTTSSTKLSVEQICQNMAIQIGNGLPTLIVEREVYDITGVLAIIKANESIFEKCLVQDETLTTVNVNV
ncbi:protein-glucosylgalactosylhydroxylysine glucosidase isoform X2 [Culex quinquefasciatus]|uniref:protein-glucosylgalactosylhydroxylysine glucosidase isoform X2 n=1 Tax=Culex quinquefasciatus TaxID=7176 RepID=UPI0018E3DD27|nr:protein-glucosylgalactosylhydroxylysine glucosidase isoform X2 [Culex quinquefasciatus]